MLPYSDSKLTRAGLVVFFIVIVLYGLYEAQGLAFGPKIAISAEAVTVRDPYVEVSGRAERIASLSMNGKAVPVTEKGDFNEPYLLAEGGNKITLTAKDAYGRVTERTVEIVYIPSPIVQSTTTDNSME